MPCEQPPSQLLGHLDGSLSAAERRRWNEHVAVCEDCRSAAEIWMRLGDLAPEQPSRELRARLRSLVQAGEARAVPWWRLPAWGYVWQGALAAALLAVGFFAGRAGDKPAPASGEVVLLRQEIRNLREEMVVAMLRNQSSNDRLRGVLTSASIPNPDSEVITALLDTMRHDPSVNVRLSAIDALKRFASDQSVRRGLADSLRNDSPLVQIALIEALVELREKQAATALRTLGEEAGVNALVKQRAQLALQRLEARSE